VVGPYKHGNEPLVSIKDEEFLDYLTVLSLKPKVCYGMFFHKSWKKPFTIILNTTNKITVLFTLVFSV
jgi:hypothetical protein